jgi:polysaccharide export outer membrane protein
VVFRGTLKVNAEGAGAREGAANVLRDVSVALDGEFMKLVWWFVMVAPLWCCQMAGQAPVPAQTKGTGAVGSAAPPTTMNDKNSPTFSERYPRYKLRPGDAFDLTFEFTPEFNQSLTILPDGFILLREAGEVYASGLTISELTEKIRTAYGSVLSNPRISISLKDFERPYFIADGQVNHPGKYDLRGDTTLVQAVAIAGGFENSAKHSQVVLYRRVNDDWIEAQLLDVKKMQKSRNLSEDVHLKPGDMIFVPKNTLSKIQQFIPSYGFNMAPGIP